MRERPVSKKSQSSKLEQKQLSSVHKERREQREKEPTEVARLFLFQSRRPEEIADNENIANMHFSELLLIHKAGDVNPGQVMPMGGKIDEGENPLKAAIREAVEEAHLRPPERSIRQIGGEHHYSFNHPSKGRLDRRAYYFKGKIGPQDFDIPYQLQPLEDKIAGFARFSPDEVEELLESRGYVERDGITYTIQDALNPNEAERIAHAVDSDDIEREAVADDIIMHHYFTDARKKMNIVMKLLNGMNVAEDVSEQGQTFHRRIRDKDGLISHIEQVYEDLLGFETMDVDEAITVLPQVDVIWNRIATEFTVEDIRRAFIRSDHEAKLSASFNYKKDKETGRFETAYNEETGVGVPTAALIFPLLLNDQLRPGQKPDIRKIRELYKNPTMSKLLRMTQKMKREMQANPDVNDDRLIEVLHEAGLIEIPRQSYNEMSVEIDTYFEQLRDAAGLEDDEAPIDQLDEIKGASFTDLMRFACMSPEQIIATQERVNSVAEARVFAWEAQRKLVLLFMLNDAVHAAETVKERTVQSITAAQSAAVAALDSPLRLYAGHMQHKKRPDGSKELMSLLRKMIVRDQSVDVERGNIEVAKDYFAESYIFDGLQEAQSQSITTDIPEKYAGRIEDKRRVITRINAPKVMTDLLYSVLDQDSNLRVIEYKPFPESGGKLDSTGGGGGGDVRLGKFYLEHTDPDSGIIRYKEIQVFIDDPQLGLSGSGEFERKKKDDRRYAVQRLFHTKGIRSFMELLFPASVYDDFNQQSRAIFTQRVG